MSDKWYDIEEDWNLIAASFAEQYGIRLIYEKDMLWSEFAMLLSGINAETPLGRVVSIRSENDKEILKNFTPEQRKIRTEWRNKQAKSINANDYDAQMKMLSKMFRDMAE